MLRISIPMNYRELKNDKVEVTRHEVQAAIDVTVNAEEKWAINFPQQAEHETVFAYVERIAQLKESSQAALLTSNLKAIFCFIDAPEITSFKEFCAIFDPTDEDMIKEQLKVIRTAFEIVLNTSGTSKKN